MTAKKLSESAVRSIVESLVRDGMASLGNCVLVSVEVDIKSYVAVGTVDMQTTTPKEPAMANTKPGTVPIGRVMEVTIDATGYRGSWNIILTTGTVTTRQSTTADGDVIRRGDAREVTWLRVERPKFFNNNGKEVFDPMCLRHGSHIAPAFFGGSNDEH